MISKPQRLFGVLFFVVCLLGGCCGIQPHAYQHPTSVWMLPNDKLGPGMVIPGRIVVPVPRQQSTLP